jgi:hypothetical protein
VFESLCHKLNVQYTQLEVWDNEIPSSKPKPHENAKQEEEAKGDGTTAKPAVIPSTRLDI